MNNQRNRNTLREVVNGLRVSNYGSSEVAEFITKHGYDVFRVAQGHNHPFSAAVRQMALIEVAKDILRRRDTLHLLSYFGAGTREAAFQNLVEKSLMEKMVKRVTDASGSVHIDSWQKYPVEGDRARGFVRGGRVDFYDATLIMDVYHLSEHLIDELLDSSSLGVYVVCRFFPGEAGVDVWPKGHTEGYWRRGAQGISFWPDGQSIAYPPHPDLNWLFTQSHGSFEVSHLRAIGPVHLLRIARSDANALRLAAHEFACFAQQAQVALVHVPRPRSSLFIETLYSTYDKLCSLLGRSSSEYLVHCDTFETLRYEYSIKGMTAWVMDTLRDKVNLSVSRSNFGPMSRFDSSFFQLVCDRTYWAIVFACRGHDIVKSFEDFRSASASAEASVVRSRKGVVEPASLLTPSVLGIGCLFIGALLFRRLRPAAVGVSGAGIWDADWSTSVLGVISRERRATHVQAALELRASGLNGVFVEDALRNTVVESPLLEELVRSWLPRVSLAVTFFEAVTCVVAEPNWRGLLSAGTTLLAHAGFSWISQTYGFAAALTAHMLHNISALSMIAIEPAALCSKRSLWIVGAAGAVAWYAMRGRAESELASRFRQAYTDGAVFEEQGIGSFCPGAHLPSFNSHYCPSYDQSGSYSVQLAGRRVPVAKILMLEDEREVVDGVYPVLVTNGLPHRPARTASNLMVALLTRVHRAPDHVLSNDVVADVIQAHVELSMLLSSTEGEYPTMAEVLARLDGPRRRRLEGAVEALELGELDLRVTIDMKNNETLGLKREDGFVFIKPRTIINVGPRVQAATQIAAQCLSRRLKQLNGKWFPLLADWRFRFFYCSGMAQSDLTTLGRELMSSLVPSTVTVLVMGDDALIVVVSARGTFQVYENDFSQYDQTQGELTLVDGRRLIYASLGFDDVVHVFAATCSGKYRSRMGKFFVQGHREAMQATGSADTTAWNSLENVVSCIVAFRVEGCFSSDGFAIQGYTAKLKEFDTFYGPTFLKGWWVPAADGSGPVWVPLPSAVLKLGKTLRDPLVVFGSYGGYCHALISCVCFHPSYPVAGSFMGVIGRFASGRAAVQSGGVDLIENPYKARTDQALEVDRDYVLGMIASRYQLSVPLIEDVERLLQQVDVLPCVVSHHVFTRLAAVDY